MAVAPDAFNTTTPESTPEASLRAMEQPTQAANDTSTDLPVTEAPASEKAQPQPQPVLNLFQLSLVVLVLVFGGSALLIRFINIQRWRKRL